MAARSDSMARVIEDGIKRPIRLLLENRSYPAALILVYSGMEMMAFLNMPAEKLDVMRSDFIAWADLYMTRYLPEGFTGRDLYGARCGALRGTDARLVREGHCRAIRYTSAAGSGIVVSVAALVEAFFRAVDTFFEEIESDRDKAELVSARLEQMRETLPF